jgi:thiol:disulfide interchange protein
MSGLWCGVLYTLCMPMVCKGRLTNTTSHSHHNNLQLHAAAGILIALLMSPCMLSFRWTYQWNI